MHEVISDTIVLKCRVLMPVEAVSVLTIQVSNGRWLETPYMHTFRAWGHRPRWRDALTFALLQCVQVDGHRSAPGQDKVN